MEKRSKQKSSAGGVFQPMKKILLGTVAAVMILVVIYLVGTGLMKMSSVYVGEYTVSEDGAAMEIRTGVAASMGYIRDMSVKKDGEEVYLTFYSAFGGLNSSLGAKNTFEIPLDESSAKIYIYRGESGYELILQKNAETNRWERTENR